MTHRIRRGVVTIGLAIAVVACSGSDDDGDLLGGVPATTAKDLCTEFFTARAAVTNARNTLNIEALDPAAEAYDTLATRARRVGAGAFAARLGTAADAAHELLPTREEVASGAVSTTEPDLAAWMTKALSFQLPDTELALSCARRGFVSTG